MESAISDLQKWRQIRNRDLALELEGMDQQGDHCAPETNEEDAYAEETEALDSAFELTAASYRKADDKAVCCSIDRAVTP
jgi:hypothetical protein